MVRVVLLGDVIEEQAVGERLEPVGMVARDENRRRIVVADVCREGLAALPFEHDDPHHALEARKQVGLAALVVVEAADHALARERQVRLLDGLGQRRGAHQLHEPAALVLETAQRDQLDAVDHALLAPFARTKSFTS